MKKKKSGGSIYNSEKNSEKKKLLKILEKLKKEEQQIKEFYRIPITQGFKDVPAEKFHNRKRELLEEATGKIVKYKRNADGTYRRSK